MTLNDLEPSQKGFLVNFSQYLDAAHISILNCDEMAGVRPRQPAYEIFSIKRRSQQSNSRSPRFIKPGAGGRQRRLLLLKVIILPQLSGVAWKRLQIGTDMLFIINFCDLLLQHKIQKWTATKRLESDWQFAKMNCYRLSRVSWALAQISCYTRQRITKRTILSISFSISNAVQQFSFKIRPKPQIDKWKAQQIQSRH